MASQSDSSENPPAVERFLDGDAADFTDLGDPPLADRTDPLLDGDRIVLTDDE